MIEIRFSAEKYSELVHKVADWLEEEKATAQGQPHAFDPAYLPSQAPTMTPTSPTQQMQPPAYQQAAPAQPVYQQMQPPAYQQPAPAQQPPVYQPQTQPAPAPVATMAPPAAPVAPPQSLPGAAPTYSLEDLMRAASSVIDAGKRPALEAALAQYGVQTMTQLPPEQYGNFAAALRSLGAQL